MMKTVKNVKVIYHWRKVNHAIDKMDKYRYSDKAKFLQWEQVYVENLNVISKLNNTK